MKELKMIMNDDGVFEEYDDTYDLTIHCTSQEEQDEVLMKLNRIACTDELPVTPQPCEDVPDNNVGEMDCISRELALEKMADYVASGYADSAEDFEEYSKIICQLPPVNPAEKVGQWIPTQRDKYIDIKCSECGNTRIEEYAYNYTVDEIDMQEIKDLVVTSKMNYCECCGAKMQEVEDADSD